MTAILTAPRTMTLGEFLDWVPGDDRHYELIDGTVTVMNPPNRAHRLILRNLNSAIDLHLRNTSHLQVEPEAGIIPSDSDRSFYEADLAVSAVPHRRGQQALPEPVLVVEVLSASTEAHDRMVKLADYRHIPSVREVLLVAQDRPFVEIHRRLDGEDRWLTDLVRGLDAAVRLDSIGLDLPLAEIYRGVDLAP
jgi:Uma2 family endonuclease